MKAYLLIKTDTSRPMRPRSLRSVILVTFDREKAYSERKRLEEERDEMIKGNLVGKWHGWIDVEEHEVEQC